MTRIWTAKTLPPELADTSQWRAVDEEALDDTDRARFVKYQAAIVAYLRTGKLAAVSEEVGLASCLLYTSPSPRDGLLSRMPSSA